MGRGWPSRCPAAGPAGWRGRPGTAGAPRRSGPGPTARCPGRPACPTPPEPAHPDRRRGRGPRARRRRGAGACAAPFCQLTAVAFLAAQVAATRSAGTLVWPVAVLTVAVVVVGQALQRGPDGLPVA